MLTSNAFTVCPVHDMTRAWKFYERILGLRLSRN